MLQRLVRDYTCQNDTLLEITCHGSHNLFITVKEDPYLTPGYLSTISRTEGDGGMISTLSEKDENRERNENKYY